MRMRFVALAAATILAGCATTPEPAAAPAAARGPKVSFVADPFPSTYRRYPGPVTAIRGATVFDGEGGRIENGTVVLADGVIRAVGGADTPVPDGATIVDGTGK